MTPEQILAIPPRVLTQAQREFYFSEGYILLEAVIGDEWINKLRDATDEMIERSRKVTKSDTIFDLEPDHRPDSSRLRRVSNPTEHHPVFWDYVNKSVMPDAVADLVGPDVEFHHSKLNFKWTQGGEQVQMPLRYFILAAHQLFTAHHRHLSLRLRHGARAAGRDPEEPPAR